MSSAARRRRTPSWKTTDQEGPHTPRTPSLPYYTHALDPPSLPVVAEDDTFVSVVRALCGAIEDAVEIPWTFEQLKAGEGAQVLLPLVDHLTAGDECSHPFLVSALLVLRYHFKDPDDRGVSHARANACELLAWRVTLSLSRQERLEALLKEFQVFGSQQHVDSDLSEETQPYTDMEREAESTGLLRRQSGNHISHRRMFINEVSFLKQFTNNRMRRLKIKSTSASMDTDDDDDPTLPFLGLNALEIAAVADAKKFISQNVVQRAINAIWKGDIMFWNSVTIHAERQPTYYSKHGIDLYCRLRVPLYQKTFETAFFASFLILYFLVMKEDDTQYLTPAEVLLYVWMAAFTYEEVGSFFDSGMRFYLTDFWNMMDVGIVGVGVAFAVTRAIGFTDGSLRTIDLAFDVLSLMAVPLVPRTFSLLSLHPYFGTLIPSLAQMTRDLLKFLVIVIVVYFGFASTFVLLARNAFTAKEMLWLLIYAFNGSGYLLLDISEKISKTFGPTIVVLFVSITNILLLPTLISLLTNSLTMVMENAREEYLFQYSILVLESCASKRLTYFLPPLNLIPLVFLRPLRLVLPASQVRSMRIILLKITHAPFVVLILAYERLVSRWQRDPERWRVNNSTTGGGSRALRLSRRHSRSGSEDRIGAESAVREPFASARQRSTLLDEVNGDTEDDLRALVADLAARVEQLQQRLTRLD